MTARESGWQPFNMSADQAALLISKGLHKKKAIVVFPRLLAFATWIGGLLPEPVRHLTGRAFRFKVGHAEDI